MSLNFQDVIRDVHNPATHSLQTSGGGATIYAVVNTGAATDSTLNIGFATVSVSNPTLYAVVNTSAAGVGNSMVTINPRTDYIGLMSVSGNVNVGLLTVTVGNQTIYAVVNTTAASGLETIFIGTPTLYAVVNTGAVGVSNSIATIVSIVPGVGATNLGKAKGSTVGATDTGVGIFGKIHSEDTHTVEDDGDYDSFALSDYHELKTRDQRSIDLANCNATIDYTALSNDTTGIAFSTNHVFGTGAITFNKVDGAANTVYAGVSKSLATLNVQEIFEAGGFVGLGCYLPSLTNVINVFLRIGDDASNYNAWTWPVANLNAATWMNLRTPAATPDYSKNLGTGWNTNSLKYVAFGVEFAGETNTLTGMIFDHIHLVGGRVTSTDVTSAITTNVNTANINLARVAGESVQVDNGTSAKSIRVTVASDSTGQIKLASGVNGVGFATVNVAEIKAGVNYIGLVSVNIGGTLPALSSGVAGIGFATVNLVNQPALTASSAFVGIVTVTNQQPLVASTVNIGSVSVLGGTIAVSSVPALVASSAYVGLASVNIGGTLPALSVGTATIGIVQVANQPALVASTAYIGLVTVANTVTVAAHALTASTVNIGSVSVLGGSINAALTASTVNVGSVSILGGAIGLNAGIAGIGFATVRVADIAAGVNKIGFATVNVAGMSALVASTVNIGSVSVLGGGIGINAGVNNIGFATVTLSGAGNPSVFAVNVGTNKTLLNLPIGFSTASVVTVAVPATSASVKITNMLLNSDATVRFTIKSGVTYLTGNASIGITLNPGGGFIMTGSPDSPSWIGLPSGALVIEKFDLTATSAKIAGNVVYFSE
jgi:hypothetical protein